MGIIESTAAGGGNQIVELCARCGRAEGVWSVPWPALPPDAVHRLCGRCLWRQFHEVPKGPVRQELVRQVFGRRVLGKSSA